MQYIKQYLFSLVVFLVIDFSWIFLVANKLYSHQIPNLLREKPFVIPALLFYVIFTVCLYVVVINPALTLPNTALFKVILHGFLFGFAAYSTFALTNRSLLNEWTQIITISDMLWGGVLGSLVSVLTFLVFK